MQLSTLPSSTTGRSQSSWAHQLSWADAAVLSAQWRWYCGWSGRHNDRSVAAARASACWRARGPSTSSWIPNGANCLLHIDQRSGRFDRTTYRSTTATRQDVRFHQVRASLVDARPFQCRFSYACIGNISHWMSANAELNLHCFL